MLPLVKKEVRDVVITQFEGENVKYIERIVEKLKEDQPILYDFFQDEGNKFVKDLMEMQDSEQRNLFIVMAMMGMPAMVYEMIRNQAEADELNALFT